MVKTRKFMADHIKHETVAILAIVDSSLVSNCTLI
jgi:hypothetical protein